MLLFNAFAKIFSAKSPLLILIKVCNLASAFFERRMSLPEAEESHEVLREKTRCPRYQPLIKNCKSPEHKWLMGSGRRFGFLKKESLRYLIEYGNGIGWRLWQWAGLNRRHAACQAIKGPSVPIAAKGWDGQKFQMTEALK